MSGPLTIGITCYPTFGGSGIIATEVGLALARRGHRVHFIATALPKRLDPAEANVTFHPVNARDYPLFPQAPYSLALASKMVEVSRAHGVQILHAHYAVPHATSAWMAREVLGDSAPRVVATLHGTDITLIGADASYLPITRHSIAQADAVSAPSNFLRDETWARFDLDPATTPIEVIHNFVDTDAWRPLEPGEPRPELTEIFGDADLPTAIHTSNFRPVKRAHWVVDAFARAQATAPSRLVLVGEGPDLPEVAAQIDRAGLSDRVRLVGNHPRIAALTRECALFLLPSLTESFGLAGLEAMASGVPVVASDVGGLPEVIDHGRTGFLAPLHDVTAFARHTAELLSDPALQRTIGQAARADVVKRFRPEPMVDRYLELYRRVLQG